jgi:hypothetical protein
MVKRKIPSPCRRAKSRVGNQKDAEKEDFDVRTGIEAHKP